ncbi:hypothetical protein GCM10023206_08110 [Acinetobacter puyangensis]
MVGSIDEECTECCASESDRTAIWSITIKKPQKPYADVYGVICNNDNHESGGIIF